MAIAIPAARTQKAQSLKLLCLGKFADSVGRSVVGNICSNLGCNLGGNCSRGALEVVADRLVLDGHPRKLDYHVRHAVLGGDDLEVVPPIRQQRVAKPR